MKKFLLAIGVTAAFTGMPAVFADQAVINEIEKAGRHYDVAALQILKRSDQAYDTALAQYRLAISYAKTNDVTKVKAALAKAVDQLESELKDKPNDIEALALVGLVYGTQAGFSPKQAGKYGMKASRSIAKAKTIAPSHPRVNLVAGINSYFTPPMYGGSKTTAIRALNQSITSYEGDADSGYHWGYAEAYVWRGLAHMELGEHEKALSDWQAALTIAPDFGWASMLLNKHK